MCEDGTPYGPKRYRDIVRECWYISDNLNTSYTDILDISYLERMSLIHLIREKRIATQEAIERSRANAANKK